MKEVFTTEKQTTKQRAYPVLWFILLYLFSSGKSFAQIEEEYLGPNAVGEAAEIVISAPPRPILNIPPGFESLAEPQTTVIDIYFGGEFLTSQISTFTPEEIEFSKPKVLIELIPGVLQPNIISDDLLGMQPANANLVCFYEGQNNCGNIQPEVAAIIFNESEFRADLFINPDYLSIQSTTHQKYLPASDSQWSWLQTFNGATAGENQQDNKTYSLNSQSTLAYKETRLNIISNYRSREQADGFFDDNDTQNSISSNTNSKILSFDTVAFRRDWKGKEYQLGYFRSNSGNFRFMSDNKIRGGRFASSLDTREDLRQTNGNELVVFLGTRSEVALFKDNRLVSSRIYDAGNQTLDTSQLPGGAYDVTIQIRDTSGEIREETRFYVKSSQLPPSDQALYFAEIGELLDDTDIEGLSQSTGLTLLRGGYHSRLNDSFGYMVGGSVVDNISAFELGLTHLGRNYDFHLGSVLGNNSRRGARFDMRYQFNQIYFSANFRQIRNDDYDQENPNPADFLGPNSTQAGLGVTAQLPFGRIEVSSRINTRNELKLKTHTLRFELPRFRLGRSELYSGFELSQEDGSSTGLLTFELRFNGEHTTGQLRPQYISEEFNDGKLKGWKSEGVVSWRDQELMPDKDLQLDLRARSVNQDTGYGAEMDFSTQSGRLRIQSEQSKTSGVNVRRYNANVFTSFMVNNDNVKLGGREQSQSALLVKIDGELQDASFDILIDGNVRGVAYPGEITAVNLRPYQTYQVTLKQQGQSFVEYDQQPKKVTLYPGNVVSLDWSVTEIDVVFGRIVDSNGNSVENALLKGVAGLATTDDIGLFQAEIKRNVATLQVETIDSTCEVHVPAYSVSNGIANLGTLQCALQKK